MTRADPDRFPLRLTNREGTPATRTYGTLLVSGAVAPLAMAAAMIAHGGWQAALAAFAELTGIAFLLSLTRLLAIGGRDDQKPRASDAALDARRRPVRTPA
jgi:hypothetical protein